MKQKTMTVLAAVLVFFLALGLTLYPLISNYHNSRHQSEIHTQYMEQVEQAEDTALQAAKELAIHYNAALIPGSHSETAFSKDALLLAAEDYDAQLNVAGNGIMTYVQIPKIGVNLPVYHGTDADTLEIGIGHLLGSSLPVGGESAHAVLTAHSGMASQKMFSDLDRLQQGDVFYLETLGETLAYQVEAIYTVLPHETELLGIVEGQDLVTLVTCTPFGVNTHRLLVRGSRIPYEEAEEIVAETIPEAEEVVSTWEQQYLRGIALGVTAVVVLAILAAVILLVRRIRK